jgi:hypothetical protein
VAVTKVKEMIAKTEQLTFQGNTEEALMLLASVKELLELIEYYYQPQEVRAYLSMISTCLLKAETGIRKSQIILRSTTTM